MNYQQFAKLLDKHPKQKMMILAPQRFLIALTGIQGGKTTGGAAWFCQELYKDFLAGIVSDYLIAAPTVKILQQSTLPKFFEMIPKDWGEWKEGAKEFRLKWGGKIYIRSTDSPDFLEGMTIRRAWLDEAGQMKAAVWVNVQGRLSVAMGRCLMTTTSYAKAWFTRTILKRAMWKNGEQQTAKNQTLDKDIALFTWRSVDNPGFPPEEYERARLTLPPAIFERRYEGMDTRLEGLVYPDFNVERDVVKPVQLPAHWVHRFGGQDFGRTNPSCILGIAEDPEAHVYYVFAEFYKSETLLRDSADFIKRHALSRVPSDPQSAQLIAELQSTYGLKGVVVPAENDINFGIERLTRLFKENRLKIFDTCTNLIDELESYHYPSPGDDGESNDKPVAKKNHACDALRYAFSLQTGKRLGLHDPLDTATKRRSGMLNQPRRSDFTPDKFTGY